MKSGRVYFFFIKKLLHNVLPSFCRTQNHLFTGLEATSKLGTLTPFTCPDCGGVLTKIDEPTGEIRFRCFTGHVFNERFLDDQYIEKTEETLWVAIRMMEERRNFNNTMRKTGINEVERDARDKELAAHIERLKSVMQRVSKDRQRID